MKQWEFAQQLSDRLLKACLEPPTERVHSNSASPTEMDIENPAYFKWTTRLDFRRSSSSRTMATRSHRIADPISRQGNTTTQR